MSRPRTQIWRRDRRRALVRRVPRMHKARNLSNSQSDTTKSQDKIFTICSDIIKSSNTL
ncbi:hypothetical protein SLEP1_g10882 [Rubroshorea leprosula]|uniref:Uncharacterized protein n=1 Tax=Rubroshorea leprosula TaxID=152421 RepID=A0AAV5IJD5_9ROSI|nr:hypothetical protein SLEP1_g10882 [Rubroshorea leprosula]